MLVVGQQVAEVLAVRAEDRGAVLDAVDGQLPHRRRQAVDGGHRDPHQHLAVGLAGDPGQPAQRLVALVVVLDPLPPQAVRADRPEEVTVPGQPLDVGLLVGVPTGQVDQVGEPVTGLPAVAVRVGDQPLDGRRLVTGHPQHRPVAAHGGEVGVRARRAGVGGEGEPDGAFDAHAVSLARAGRLAAAVPGTAPGTWSSRGSTAG